MAKGQQLVKEFIKQFEKHKGFSYCARNCKLIACNEGHVRAELEITNEHLNPPGTLHGGCTATVISLLSTAAMMTIGRSDLKRSMDLNISYLNSVKLGETISIDSKVLRVTRNLAFTITKVKRKSDNSVIATGNDVKTIVPPM